MGGMKCPQCVREGLRSRVYPDNGSAVTLLGYGREYDEDGALHIHDPNRLGCGYRCSLGHRWSESWLPRCPSGDYGGEITTRELPSMVRVPVPVWVLTADGLAEGEPIMEWRVPD